MNVCLFVSLSVALLSPLATVASPEADALYLLSRFMDDYRVMRGNELPTQWEDLPSEQRTAVSHKAGQDLEGLYVFVHPHSLTLHNGFRILLIGTHPASYEYRKIGRLTLAQGPDGGLVSLWVEEPRLRSLCAVQGVDLDALTAEAHAMDGTPAPDLGYTEANPRPIRTRPPPRAPLEDPWAWIRKNDPAAWSNMEARARESWPEPVRIAYSNWVFGLKRDPAQTNRVARNDLSSTATNAAAAASEGRGAAPLGVSGPQRGPVGRLVTAGLVGGLLAVSVALRRRHRRKRRP